jgi:hypothetical protein
MQRALPAHSRLTQPKKAEWKTQELQTAVSNAFANIVASGAIEKAIEEKLTGTITSPINEDFQC